MLQWESKWYSPSNCNSVFNSWLDADRHRCIRWHRASNLKTICLPYTSDLICETKPSKSVFSLQKEDFLWKANVHLTYYIGSCPYFNLLRWLGNLLFQIHFYWRLQDLQLYSVFWASLFMFAHLLYFCEALICPDATTTIASMDDTSMLWTQLSSFHAFFPLSLQYYICS